MIDLQPLPERELGTYFVYGLRDPDSQEFRYVGVTCNLKDRATIHNSYARMGRDAPAAQWIAALHSQRKSPVLDILCELKGSMARRLSEAAEKKAIGLLSFENRLLNVFHNTAVLLERRRKYRRELITYNGKTMNVAAWARTLGLSRERLRQRLEKYSVELALATPKGRKPAAI